MRPLLFGKKDPMRAMPRCKPKTKQKKSTRQTRRFKVVYDEFERMWAVVDTHSAGGMVEEYFASRTDARASLPEYERMANS